MRHKHRYGFVSRHISSFVMQRMHVLNAQWENTATRDDEQANMEISMYLTMHYILPSSIKKTPNMNLDLEMIL